MRLPSYAWETGPEFYCADCGACDERECLCHETHPDDVAEMIDEAQAARQEAS